jgi:alpha-L-fucosidase
MDFRFGDGRDWFFKKRLGLFIHWGIYSIPGWHEQHIYRKKMSREEYAPLKDRFNPQNFDPDKWLDAAANAGMEYICFTAKHIDGFCMWDSAETDFKITNTPYKKDTLRMLADACHKRDFPLCLYYSVPDNSQRSYPHGGHGYDFPSPPPGDEPDEAKYFDYVRRQARELCQNYGKIHGFWWDANVLKKHDPSINSMIRELQPGIIINNRGMDEGDFGTPERDWDTGPEKMRVFERPVEACQSVGIQSWGYRKDEDYYSDTHLITSIQKTLAKGGNYLLNIGPAPDGTFPPEAAAILKRLGVWFRSVRESLTDAEPASGMTVNNDVLLTRKDNILYVHLIREPLTSAVYLPPILDNPESAEFLGSGEKVDAAVCDLPWNQPGGCLSVFNLPVNSRRLAGAVLKLKFKQLGGGAAGAAFGEPDKGAVARKDI